MSPEQVRDEPVDSRSDIFSFGVVLYEMLTGVQPFGRDGRTATLDAILNDEALPLRAIHPAIPQSLERIVHRCLQKQPGQRFQSIADVKAALEKELRAPTRVRKWFIAVTCIITAVAIVAAILSTKSSSVPPPSQWTQLTDFADSAVQPALSPDGRKLAFIRSSDTFASSGQIYVKSLPDGEPAQITNDNALKFSPAFSPDGSQLAYTVAPRWDSWIGSLRNPNASCR